MSQVSMVPHMSSPFSAISRAPSTLSRIQAIFVAEKYASGTRPVRSRMRSAWPSSTILATASAVRRHCHTTAS